MTHHRMPGVFAAMLVLAVVTPGRAQQDKADETAFLQSFEGRFSGTGTLERAGGSSHALSCKFDGDHAGSRVTLNGNCSTALVFSTSVRIELRYDPRTQRYEGAFREGKGTVADLAGTRQGQRLSLSFTETPESVRPNPPATLTISLKDDGMALTLRGSKPGQGQNLDLSLNET